MLKKCCPRCGKLIDYSITYCTECSKKVEQLKRQRHREYKAKRMADNKEKILQEFYVSKEWIKVRDNVKVRCFYLDIYSYYIEGAIENGNTVHHIEPLRECWNKRLYINNLIYLTESNHQLIHRMLDKDYKGTVNMLQELTKRWYKDFLERTY